MAVHDGPCTPETCPDLAVHYLRGQRDSLALRVRSLEAVERAARELLPFLPEGYAGVPLANLRHALAALAGGENTNG